jgi:hypothetical protein
MLAPPRRDGQHRDDVSRAPQRLKALCSTRALVLTLASGDDGSRNRLKRSQSCSLPMQPPFVLVRGTMSVQPTPACEQTTATTHPTTPLGAAFLFIGQVDPAGV